LERYVHALDSAGTTVRALAREHPLDCHYLLPMAYRVRALFKMDLAEAAYIAELRSGPAGHFSYREVAWQMFEALRDRFPAFAAGLRVSNPREHVDLLKR
jgi:thymidylate synthase ThyX